MQSRIYDYSIEFEDSALVVKAARIVGSVALLTEAATIATGNEAYLLSGVAFVVGGFGYARLKTGSFTGISTKTINTEDLGSTRK